MELHLYQSLVNITGLKDTNLSASKTCALEILGIISIAKDVVPRFANFSTAFLFCVGYMKEIKVDPSFNISISLISPSILGARTFRTMLLSPQTVLLSDKVTPAFSYASSVNCASAPAPRSTSICLNPFLRRRIAFWGVIATRRSLG